MAFASFSFSDEANDVKNPHTDTKPIKGQSAADANADITNEAEYAEAVKAEEVKKAELKKSELQKAELKKDGGTAMDTSNSNKQNDKPVTKTPSAAETKTP